MAKKVKSELVYVKCRNCKNASNFGDNSAYCRAKGHRVCACDRYGQICNSFQKKNYNEIGENYEYRDADKDT